MIEYLLIAVTFVVAVIGIYWKEPKRIEAATSDPKGRDLYRYVPHFLFVLALGTSIASILKAREDGRDKEFLQLALTSSLVPSHSGYNRFYADFGAAAKTLGYDDANFTCHHNEEGLACFFASRDGSKHGTLVLDKAEVAQMYATQLQRKDNQVFCKALFDKRFAPSVFDEEFLDKVGILGFMTYYNIYGTFPANYFYDASFGVKVVGEGEKPVIISPADLVGIPADSGLRVFRKIEDLYRERFKNQR